MCRLARFAWAVLGYNIAVIVWGAYVRATGSGAGCGAHWPLCNGEILPRAAKVATLIEFSHRLTSGLALVAVAALFFWTWRATRPGHPARAGSALSLFFMLTEAAVGAGLVLFQLVADNASFARAMFLSVHLINTFTLLACLTLTAWWLSGGAPIALRRPARPGGRHRSALCRRADREHERRRRGAWRHAVSGVVADRRAVGGPVGDVARADSPAHPAPGVRRVGGHRHRPSAPVAWRPGRGRRRHGSHARVSALAVVQVTLGMLNVFLLAPVWLQLAHLLVADAVWIALILLGASVLGREASTRAAAHAA